MSAKAVKTITLRLPGLIGLRHLRSITSRSASSLASRAASTCAAAACSVARRLRSSIRSCFQRTRSTSLSSTLTLRPTSRLSKAGIVDVHVVDVDLLNLLGVGLDAGQRGLHVRELALDRERERR